MPEKKCYHFHNTTDEATDTKYCKDCNEILFEEVYWGGEFYFGKLETRFEEVSGDALDFAKLICDHVGAPRVVIQGVKAVVGKRNWVTELEIAFTLSGATHPLTARISYSRQSRFLPTGEFFVAPETAEDLTPEV